MHGIARVDHPVIAVRSLETGRLSFERLGFTVSARGSHPEWGTGNYCIMFPEDYLELTGIIDSRRYTHNLEAFLRVREGIVGLALGTADADASCGSLAAAGIALGPVHEVTRNFQSRSGFDNARFRVGFLDKVETPGLPSTAICQHLTPELIRDPVWLRHRNTAFGIASVTVPVPDLDSAIGFYRRLFGAGMSCNSGSSVEFQIERGAVIRLVSTPGPERLAVAIRDLTAACESLENSGIRFTSATSDTLLVGANDACGVVLEFIERRPQYCR